MFLLYEVLAIIFILFSPIIFFIRLITGKEDVNRILEKYCIYSKNYKNVKTIWFHGASVGEILSIIPIIKILEKNKKIKRILLTSTTKSSALIYNKYKFKKTIHAYYPIDENNLTKRFINYWKPHLAIFIDSEIWPNMFINLNKKKIPILLVNGRITSKSFYRWMKFIKFAKQIFSKITLALPQNKETAIYLKKLGVKNIKISGNLKYFGEIENNTDQKLIKFFKNKNIFCCVSTHNNEEKFIGQIHKEIKKVYKSLITVIIPRHINRTNYILNELEGNNLKVVTRSSGEKLHHKTDIYIVDTYGETQKFYKLSNICFVGGSLVPHGGQNPLEPARNNNFILHGQYIDNFTEVYSMLSKLKITKKVKNVDDMKKIILNKIKHKQSKNVISKLNLLGKNILKRNFNEINKYLK
mgnify:CR=1 FL=1